MRLQVEDRGAGDVGRHEVGRELDPGELQAEEAREHSDEGGLSDAGHVVDQHVRVGEDADEHQAERVAHPEQSPVDALGEGREEVTRFVGSVHTPTG